MFIALPFFLFLVFINTEHQGLPFFKLDKRKNWESAHLTSEQSLEFGDL